MFKFALTPLDRVTPWGEAGSKYLSWYALTEGEYWIETESQTLLEYHPAFRRRHGGPRHCDYFVSHFHRDLLDMAPYILAPIPADLQGHVSGAGGRAWRAALDRYLERADAAADARARDEHWGIVELAAALDRRRRLDDLYLKHGFDIRFWSDEACVHLEWDCTEAVVDSTPVWAADRGSQSVPRAVFVAELADFHRRFVAAMAARVEAACAGGTPPGVAIDVAGLRETQAFESAPAERQLARRFAPADWNNVARAVRAIEAAAAASASDRGEA